MNTDSITATILSLAAFFIFVGMFTPWFATYSLAAGVIIATIGYFYFLTFDKE